MLSLGHELKRAREERGITLHEIANATHIGVRFLQAIESDSYDILPGGVFNRAFVRKFAKQVGFDEQQAIKLYEEQLEEMGGEPQRRYYTGLDDIDARPTSGNGLLFSLLALIVLGAGAYLAYEYFKGPASGSANDANQNIAPATPTPAASPVLDASPTPSTSPASNLQADGLKLQLIANSQQCWVKVERDAEKPEEVTLQPGDAREFSANEKIVLNLGNYPALRVIVNGRPLNFAKFMPNQKSVVAKNVVITKDNYQQFVD